MRTRQRISAALRAAAATVVTVVTVGLVVTPGTAQAVDPWEPLQRSCSVNGVWYLPSTCKTGFVEANPTFHRVWFVVDPSFGCTYDWQVRDGVNNNVVGYGRYKGSVLSSSIGGLYSWYRVEITRVGSNCGGNASIRNTA
jgi:hypothetical protein